MTSIHDLSDDIFDCLYKHGHLGELTRDIAELQHFYNEVEEEKLRRKLRLREIQKLLPIQKCYALRTDYGTYFFKVIDCNELKGAEKENHPRLTHLCHVRGFVVHDNKFAIFDNKNEKYWQLPFEKAAFGYNSKIGEMVFYKDGNYEINNISIENFNKTLKQLEAFGFEF